MTDDHIAEEELDLAEALLMQGGRWREVKAVCSELVEFFRNAEMITGRLTAVAFLDDAAHQERLSARDIRHVRQYLTRVAETPDLLFHYPDDRATTPG